MLTAPEHVGLDEGGREEGGMREPLWRVVDELLPLVGRRGEAVGGGAAPGWGWG